MLVRTMKRVWMLIGKSSRCKWASSHLSSCPVCPRPAAREKPVVRQLRNEWSPTTGHAALNVYIILDNAHIVQRTVIEIPKIYLRRVLSKEYGMDAILFFSQHPLSCRITFSPLKGWTNILLKTDLCLQQRCADGWLSNNLSCQSRKTKTCGSILGQMNSPHSAPPCIGNGVFVIFFPLIPELIFYISISNCIVYWWPEVCRRGCIYTGEPRTVNSVGSFCFSRLR